MSKGLCWSVVLVGITDRVDFCEENVQTYHLCLHHLIGGKLTDVVTSNFPMVILPLVTLGSGGNIFRHHVVVFLALIVHCRSVVAQVLSTRTVTLDRLDLKVANCRMAWLINLLTRLFASTISTYVCRALQQQLDGHASDLLGAMNGKNIVEHGTLSVLNICIVYLFGFRRRNCFSELRDEIVRLWKFVERCQACCCTALTHRIHSNICTVYTYPL